MNAAGVAVALFVLSPGSCEPLVEEQPAGFTCSVDEYHANGNSCPTNPTPPPYTGWDADVCLIYNDDGTGTSKVGATPCDMTWSRGYEDLRV